MVYGYFNGKVLGLRVSVSVRKKDVCINVTNITIFYVYPRIGLTEYDLKSMINNHTFASNF